MKTRLLLHAAVVVLAMHPAWRTASAASAAQPSAPQAAAIKVKDPARAPLFAVSRNEDRLVAVGVHGLVVLSDDSGKSWRQVDVPVDVDLTTVTFTDQNKGWVGGHQGVVLFTNDKGETWSRKLTGETAARIILSYAEEKRQRLGGDADNELRRARGLVEDGPDKPFLAIMPQSGSGEVIALGAYNLTLRTADAGESWVAWNDRLDNKGELHPYAVAKVGRGSYVVGERGLIQFTADGGNSFAAVPSPYVGSFFGALAADRENVLIFGLKGNAFVSEDGGAGWRKSSIPTDHSFTSGAALNDGRIVLATDTGFLFVSEDKGRSFSRIPERIANSISSIVQAPDGSLVAVGLQGAGRVALSPAAEQEAVGQGGE